MTHEYTFEEISVFILSFPILIMSIIAMIDIDYINNTILKERGTNAYGLWISNKKAWRAGFKVYIVLTILALIALGSVYLYKEYINGDDIELIIMFICLSFLAYSGLNIIYRSIKYLFSK